jgi:hypothetical protein
MQTVDGILFACVNFATVSAPCCFAVIGSHYCLMVGKGTLGDPYFAK